MVVLFVALCCWRSRLRRRVDASRDNPSFFSGTLSSSLFLDIDDDVDMLCTAVATTAAGDEDDDNDT